MLSNTVIVVELRRKVISLDDVALAEGNNIVDSSGGFGLAWDDDPHRLRSLGEVLRANANQFIAVGKAFQRFGAYNSPMHDGPLPDEISRPIQTICRGIKNHCAPMAMRVTSTLASGLEKDLASGEVASQGLPGRLEAIQRAFQAEVDTRLLLVIPEDRAAYWVSPRHDECGAEIAPILDLVTASFGDAAYDLREAANCFACERYTASVYHQMRVAEFGLVAVADSISLTEEEKFSWERMLQGVQRRIKTIESTKPTGWDADRKKYSDLCNWFTTIKTGWRNPASHIPRIYEEPTARAMFSTLRGLFEHLKGYGITQVQMPRAIAKPDEECE